MEDWCEPPIDGEIEEGVEFFHTSSTRGNAPTLCFDGTKRKVKGKAWRAVGKENIECANSYMENREGRLKEVDVKLADGRIVKAQCGNTKPDLKGKTAKEIAKLAVKSELRIGKGGGVTYIRKSKKIGIVTPMLDEILKEIEQLEKEKQE